MGIAAVIAAALWGAVAIPATGGPHRSHGAIRHFDLAAVSRPSATRRVLELSGRGMHLLGARDPARGVTRVGDRLLITGSAADDTLIVDFSHGDPVPSGGLVYDGGGHHTRVGNVLVVRGGHFHDAVYDYSSPSAGSIHLDRASITYRNLQPVANSGTAANVVFNLPAGANDARIQDDGTAGNNRSELFSGAGTFETTTFTNPSSSLTINGGGSSDTLTVAPSDSFSSADVTTGGEGIVNTDSLTTTGTLRITAGSVDEPRGGLHVGALGANTSTGISLNRANRIGTLAGSVSGAGAGASLVSNPLAVGTVPASGSFAGANGLSSAGPVTLSTTSDASIRAPVAATGALTINCGTAGNGCLFDAPAGGLTGTPVSLSGGPGTDVFNVEGEVLNGAGPLMIDGGSRSTSVANVSGASITASPDAGLVLDHLGAVNVTGSTFKDNKQDGILVENSSNGTIGGTAAGQPNTISGNGADGIRMVSGAGVQFRENSILSNGQLGISLEGGANHGQSAPVLTFAAPSGASTHVEGSLHSTPNRSFALEFFDNPTCDASGFGEARTFIGSTNVTTDGGGNASFDATVPGGSTIDDAISATATDTVTGDTSGFSQCLQRAAPTVSIATPTDGGTFKLHQVVGSSFTCAEGFGGPGLASCLDQAGRLSGAALNTSTPGRRAFSVIAKSLDGQSTVKTVVYTVQPPPNQFTLSHKKLKRTSGVVSFDMSVPGAGSVTALESMLSAGRQFVSGRAHLSPRRRQTLHVTIKPNGRGLHLVRHHQRLVSVQLQVTFTPVGGPPHSVRFALSLK